MEQDFADLITDAFSDSSLPSFPEGELDFEPLHFEGYLEEPKAGVSHGTLPVLTEEDEAPNQEVIGQTRTLSGGDSLDTYDITLTADDTSSSEEEMDVPDQERATGTKTFDVRVTETPVEHHFTETLNDDYTHKMEEDDIDSEEDQAEDTGTETLGSPGDWSVMVHRVEAFCDGDQEDMGMLVTESQPLALEGTEHPQVRKEEKGEIQNSDVTYFGTITARGNVRMTEQVEKQRGEESQEESSDSDHEGSTSSSIDYQRDGEQEVNILSQFVPLDDEDDDEDRIPGATDCPELAMPNMDGLVDDGFAEQPVKEKMEDFSGDDHQEAGESFADYPSDFSSCEYVQGKREENEENVCKPPADPSENIVLESEPVESKEQIDEEEDQDMDEGWIGMGVAVKGEVMGKETEETGDGEEAGNEKRDAGRCLGEEVAVEDLATSLYKSYADSSMRQTFEDSLDDSDSSSYTSSDYENQERTDEELPECPIPQGHLRDKITADLLLHRQGGDNISKHKLPSGTGNDAPIVTIFPAYQCPTEGQAGELDADFSVDRSLATRGTVDDSFMYDDEYKAWEITEEEDDAEEERERNWAQEQKRIQAFYRFYNDEDEEDTTEKEERKTRVQFCMDPLSQIFQYDADSSSEGEEDLSSAEGAKEETEPETLGMNPTSIHPKSQMAEGELGRHGSTTPKNHCNKDRCLRVLKSTLKMCLVTLMGLAMFWWATDHLDWLG